jgi:ANTAR domain
VGAGDLLRDAELLAAQLRLALARQAIVEQAVGIIMARRRVGPNDAKAVLCQIREAATCALADAGGLVVSAVLAGATTTAMLGR